MVIEAGHPQYTGRLPSAVMRLIHDPRRVTAARLWRALEDEEQVAALQLLMRRRKDRDELVRIVATARKFRPRSVSGMDNAKIVQMAKGLPLPPALLVSMLDEMHLERRREMLAHFLGTLGIPNDDGVVERYEDHDPGQREVRAAADDLVREHGLRRSVVYFLTLCVLQVPFADHLWMWMRRSTASGPLEGKVTGDDARAVPAADGKDVAASPGDAAREDADVSGAEDPSTQEDAARASTHDGVTAKPRRRASVPVEAAKGELSAAGHVPSGEPEARRPSPVDEGGRNGKAALLPAKDAESLGVLADEGPHLDATLDPVPQPSLRKLDDLLIGALIDSRQGVEGCLDEDEISDAVDDFVDLNGSRPQSCFHAGFRDSLFGRPLMRDPAEDEARLRWYWAGVVRGWSRNRRSLRRIVDAYNANPVIRDFGDGRDRCTEEAAPHVLQALWREGRAQSIPDFLSVRGLSSSRSLFTRAFEVGTSLLREDELAEADAIFDRLLRAENALEAAAPSEEVFLAVRRRRAHCLQRLLEYHRARRLLEELVEIEDDSNYLAMAHADLGLIAGRFSELEEVALPSSKRDLPDFLDRLRAGSSRYARAVEEDVPYAAHGEYCLGVLALGEQRWDEAEEHLKSARARFGSAGASYRQALRTRNDLYFGIARAGRAQTAQDLAHSARIMERALAAGARFPRYLFAPAVEGLRYGAGSDDLATFANALVGRHGDEALDELSRSDTILGDCPTVLDALRGRASQRGVSEAAAADFRRCLVGYLKAGRLGEAGNTLDRLEDLARQRVGTNEFQELLKESGYQPAWDPEDAAIARVGVLEARGEIEDAFTELEKLFWSFLGHPNRLGDAEGILERIRRLGVEAQYFERHEKALAARTDEPAAEVGHPVDRAPVKVLFVGGDERQAKAEHAVRNRLRREAPHIDVTFVFPGWSGNWIHALNDVRGKIKTHDALALMRLVRTEFGRQCRKCCGAESKPWRSCWVAGQRAMAASIIAAANAAG